MKKFFLVFVILIILAGAFYFYIKQNTGSIQNIGSINEPIILLDKKGFNSAHTIINIGQRVTFKNKSGRPFWPASDFHPTHEIYSEFDPKGPIQNDADWSFIFEKPGIWSYHDHLAPYLKGVIEVRADVVVIRKDDGFYPQEITIKKWTRVVWKNESGTFFWPASALHPTHELYPEFDPKEPIPDGQTWSFTFEKIGDWPYHDHLKPSKKGTVKVVE